MSEHVVVAHLAAMTAPLAAALAVLYAAAPATRRVLRWPLVVTALLTAALMVVAGNAGHQLLDELRASGATAEYEAAYRHAKSSDLATTAAVLTAILAVVGGLAALRPDQPSRLRSRIVGVALAAAGVGLAGSTIYTVILAVEAAWGAA